MTTKRKSPFAGLKKLLLQYSTFTMPERKGIFVFMLLQILLVVALIYLKFTEPVSSVDFTRLDITIKEYNRLMEKSRWVEQKMADTIVPISNTAESVEKPALFSFNPNHLADSCWKKLGLNEKQIKTIKKFEMKGGKFYAKSDVKKMYVISEEEYMRLAPFIMLPETKPAFQKDSPAFAKPLTDVNKPVHLLPLEINIANEEELITIPGIGPGRASAIISYRNKLGGYVELDQVREAFGMDSVYEGLKKYLQLEIYITRRININTGIPADLRHPYISPGLATIIVNYRKAHGDYADISDLKKLELVDDALFKKLAPYLKVK